jgi:hypothetical protein
MERGASAMRRPGRGPRDAGPSPWRTVAATCRCSSRVSIVGPPPAVMVARRWVMIRSVSSPAVSAAHGHQGGRLRRRRSTRRPQRCGLTDPAAAPLFAGARDLASATRARPPARRRISSAADFAAGPIASHSAATGSSVEEWASSAAMSSAWVGTATGPPPPSADGPEPLKQIRYRHQRRPLPRASVALVRRTSALPVPPDGHVPPPPTATTRPGCAGRGSRSDPPDRDQRRNVPTC